MKFLSILATLLLIIGGINWGLVGLMHFDLVQFLLGGTGIDRIIYIAIGASGVWRLIEWCGCCKCSSCR